MNYPPQIIATTETLNSALEVWFIQNLIFSGAPFITGYIPENISSDIVIYLELNNIDRSVVRRLRILGKKVVLYHMGDELAQKDITAYKEFDLVVRNYYFEHIFTTPQTNLIWAPNGYKSGAGPRKSEHLKSAIARKNFACFLGWLNNEKSFQNERMRFSIAAKECKNLRLLSSNGFASGLNTSLYAATMEDSIFAPCPAGNSPETIRLYDALESGCIPITLHHDFISSPLALASIGQPPFPILKSWDQLPSFLAGMSDQLRTDPSSITLLQQETVQWWTNFKISLQSRVLDQMTLLGQ